MHKLLATLAAIILLIVGGYIVFHSTNSGPASSPSSTVSPTEKVVEKVKENKLATYTSTKFGFSFDYPSNYTFTESSPIYLLIEKMGGEQYNWTYKVDVENDIMQGPEKTVDKPFKEFIFDRLMIGCAADGPGSSIRCDIVTKSEPFLSKSGIEGLKVYLNQVSTHGKDIEHKEIGPFYAFDTAKQSSRKARAIVFAPSNFDTLEDADLTTLASIASSLTIK